MFGRLLIAHGTQDCELMKTYEDKKKSLELATNSPFFQALPSPSAHQCFRPVQELRVIGNAFSKAFSTEKSGNLHIHNGIYVGAIPSDAWPTWLEFLFGEYST